jgi:hypothetical protein
MLGDVPFYDTQRIEILDFATAKSIAVFGKEIDELPSVDMDTIRSKIIGALRRRWPVELGGETFGDAIRPGLALHKAGAELLQN